MDGPRSTPSPLWIHSCTSLVGTSHLVSRAPCQDASAVLRLGRAGEIVILALSDGAGSAPYSDRGAQTVVACWQDFFEKLLTQSPDPDAVLAECGPAKLDALFTDIRLRVERDALGFETTPADFSATLLGAVVTPSGALVAQVGDGCWVGLVHGILGCLTWPMAGEFAGQTVFATSESAPHALQMAHLSRPPEALVGFTDGLERLLLDFQTHLPAAGFFRPVFQAFKASPQTFGQQLKEYLESKAVCDRTDDDKSIAIVLNPQADL